MIIPALFFAFAFVTLAALMWSGYELFRDQEDPLGDRLEELQAHAIVTNHRGPRRKGGGGFLNSFLYFVSLVPGGEEWIRETEKELAQAGIRRRQATGLYALGSVLFMMALLGLMLYLQRDNDFTMKLG